MGKRRDSRVLALKSLYIYELVGGEIDDIINDVSEKESISEEKVIEYANNIVNKVVLNMTMMNEIIEECAKNWTIKRMAVLDRNILRIAIAEIFLQESVPDIVAIDEAIEIAKEYSTDDSGGFVNGILDFIIKNKEHFEKQIKL